MKTLTIREVGRLFGVELPDPPGKAHCPIRTHKRSDRTFRVFVSRKGEPIWKCWSCDAPNNMGDAIFLYALMAGIDRKAAWRRLAGDGYAVPGLGDGGWHGARTDASQSAYAKASRRIPVEGSPPKTILPFDPKLLEDNIHRKTGVLHEFAEKRGMTEAFMRAHGVVEMIGGPLVGFVYYHPETRLPTRIKVRGTREKVFWVEPRTDKDDKSGARAYAPLFLANELIPPDLSLEPVIITEGELDALALMSTGIQNVVSLPDGAAGALTADLSILFGYRYGVWLVATDDDGPGEKAYQTLRSRAAQETKDVAVLRVHFRGTNEAGELYSYKDANAALLDGFTRDDFLVCMEMAGENAFHSIEWRSAS